MLANSVWVYMDMERMRPMRIPEKVADAYRPEIGEELPGEWGARKLSVPEDGTVMPPVPVVLTDGGDQIYAIVEFAAVEKN